jgi:hypothetical protein
MPVFEVVPARRHHCGILARQLRAEQAEATVRLGVHVHRRLVEVFEASSFCRAWTIDGRVAGIGGVEGSILAAEGVVWLALSAEACRYPVALVKEARRQLHEIMRTRRRIVTTIFESDLVSMRFAVKLDFERCGDPFQQNGECLIPVSLGANSQWPLPPS